MAIFPMIGNDVAVPLAFYTGPLGFALDQQYGAVFAILSRDEVQL